MLFYTLFAFSLGGIGLSILFFIACIHKRLGFAMIGWSISIAIACAIFAAVFYALHKMQEHITTLEDTLKEHCENTDTETGDKKQ